VHAIFQRLFDREAVNAGADGWSYDAPLKIKRERLAARLATILEGWLGDGESGRDAAVVAQLVKRKAREADRKDLPETRTASKQADKLSLVLRLGDFAFERSEITAEQVAEHLKRLRNDWCKGSLRDILNKFVPQPVARRHAHIRFLEPVEVHGGEDPAHLMGLVRHAMQDALNDINAELATRAGRMVWPSPFYLPIS
jgi:hypothetical protein